MIDKQQRDVVPGDKFRGKNKHAACYEVLEVRDMKPARHALIVKDGERKSPVLIAVSTLLDKTLYEKI